MTMIDLDDPQVYRQLDPSHMLARIHELPLQCRQAWQRASELELPGDYTKVDKIVILGMGGSAIGGDFLHTVAALESGPLVFVHRDYDLPPFVDGDTLVIASSYSGNTEETLSCFEQALKAGARGYLLKDSVEEELVRAIQLAVQGRSFFSPAVATLLADRRNSALPPDAAEDRYDLLTERERQVYQLLAEGNSNKEIASLLSLSLHTVETHRTRIMEKMDIHSAAELVLSAVRRGLVR